MITYLLPTRDRHERLQQTLAALAKLDAAEHERWAGGAEVIIIDNASSVPVRVPSKLSNGFDVRVIRRDCNEGAAARNVGAREATGEWLVMLDDDSYPLDDGHLNALGDVEDDVAAVGAEIFLPNGQREAGGLPEVIIGCGAAIRRDAFLDAGGYDPSFDYYAEEYDLCAKLLINGWRVIHDRRFRVRHDKIAAGRDMNRILHRLVRNNCWVMQRYAPQDSRQQNIFDIISRYAQVAIKENAACGFAAGMSELLGHRNLQQSPMTIDLFERFTGVAQVRNALSTQLQPEMSMAVVDRGKNSWAIDLVLNQMGISIVDQDDAEVVIIGTLSPGPMLDAFDKSARAAKQVVLPWLPRGVACGVPVEFAPI